MQRYNNALTSCHDGDAADAIIWRVRCGDGRDCLVEFIDKRLEGAP